MQLINDGSCYIVNGISPSKFYPGLTPRNQGQCKYDAYSLWCKQDLRRREVMDSNIPDILGASNELFCKIAVLQWVYCWEN